MPEIDAANRYVTLINIFTVKPETQRALVDLLNEVTESVMRHQPGFVSASIHESADGTRVANYAQWESEESFKTMMGNAAAREHMAKAASLAEADPHLYRVDKVHGRD
jgi:quinol monooxygenase YgiN